MSIKKGNFFLNNVGLSKEDCMTLDHSETNLNCLVERYLQCTYTTHEQANGA